MVVLLLSKRRKSTRISTRTTRLSTWRVLATVAALMAGIGAAQAAARDAFPDPRPATRAAAVALVAGETPAPLGCLTPQVQGLSVSRLGASPAARRALTMLQRRSYSGAERHVLAADGTRVGYTDSPSAFDRVAPADLDGNGTPDHVQHVLEGLGQARSLLVDRLQLPAPVGVEVLLLELGPDLEGYLVAREHGTTIVLDGWPGTDAEAVRSAAAHQYAHAVAHSAGPHMPREWGEALATWTTIELDGGPDGVVAALLSTRLERMGAGLLSRDLELAAGNAIWFAFLNEAYGPAAVSVTAQELARGGSTGVALDRAMRRVSDDGLNAAFREFQLWSVLVGPRSDRHHFSFSGRLDGPFFTSTADGLPALSVQTDPSVAPWGATQIRIAPDAEDGGLGLRFEGEIGARWEADLLLVDATGTMRRLALDLSAEGWAEITVPLDQVAEALLLVRNVGSEDGAAHRYTYAVHRDRGYPLEIAAFEARQQGETVDVYWESRAERELIGFNILRVREDGGAEEVVNPVWIPALGEGAEPTYYQYADRDTEPGVAYVYRIQAITTHGLTSLSDPVSVRLPPTP